MAKPMRRSAAIGAIDEANRTVEIAFSSDAVLERWSGVCEVLSHDPDSVDMSRLENGAALLFNHDPDKQIGVVESASIDKDGKGRAVVRFGTSAFAEEKWQDVKNKILTKTSVGYQINEVKLTEESENGPDVYTVTAWEPQEISFVTIPADDSVGVGRSAERGSNPPAKTHNQQPKKNNTMNRDQIIALLTKRGVKFATDATDEALVALAIETEPARIDVGAERSAARDGEQARTRTILELGDKFKMPEVATRAIKEGKSVDETRELLLAEFETRSTNLRDANSPVGMTEREAQSFSFLKLMRALANPTDTSAHEAAKMEIEACSAAADRIKHREVKGTMIPIDVMQQSVIPRGNRAEGGNIVSQIIGTGYTGTGGTTVQTSLLASSFIDILRNKTVLLKLASSLTGQNSLTTLPVTGSLKTELPHSRGRISGLWRSRLTLPRTSVKSPAGCSCSPALRLRRLFAKTSSPALRLQSTRPVSMAQVPADNRSASRM